MTSFLFVDDITFIVSHYGAVVKAHETVFACAESRCHTELPIFARHIPKIFLILYDFGHVEVSTIYEGI